MWSYHPHSFTCFMYPICSSCVTFKPWQWPMGKFWPFYMFGQIHCSSAWHSTHHCQTQQCFKSRHVATCCRRRQTAVWSVLSSLWFCVAFEILFGRLPEVGVAPAHRTLLPSAGGKVTFWDIVKRCLPSYPKFEDRWKTCFPLWVNITLTWQPTRADGKK